MHRNTLRDISFRSVHGLARSTINEAKDNPMMQEMSADMWNNDKRQKVERVQNYGFTSVPMPRDQQQQQGGGQGDGGEAPKGPAAEAIMMFQGGQRNHPVIIGVDDRRHRPRLLKPGENAQYDDIGQMTLMRRNGLFLLTKDGGGDDKEGDTPTERFVSLRHVEKEKQKPPQKQQSGGQSQGQAQEEDFKHEGETVNLEIKVSKKRIEFKAGDQVVGYYDKESATWVFIGKVKLGTEDASHPVYGMNAGFGYRTDPDGDDAVFVNATKPGEPTKLDLNP